MKPSLLLPGQVGRGRLPPLQRGEIEPLACCEPAGVGVELTHRSTRTLAQVAVARGSVPHLAHSTVSLIWRQAALQPHRWRYWKTPTLNAAFRQRAARVLWCYEGAARRAERDEEGICLDEKPHLQALERGCPTRPMCPGQIERQEVEYIRPGTANVLVALGVHTGRRRGGWLERTEGGHLRQVLPQVFRHHRRVRRLHVIWEGGPSHTAAETYQLLRAYPPWGRLLETPAHAAWLNQAALLLRALSARYLHRGPWRSRQHLIDHLAASRREYKRLFAHPFTWSWPRPHMHQWLDRRAQ